jgi:hypothetical protein
MHGVRKQRRHPLLQFKLSAGGPLCPVKADAQPPPTRRIQSDPVRIHREAEPWNSHDVMIDDAAVLDAESPAGELRRHGIAGFPESRWFIHDEHVIHVAGVVPRLEILQHPVIQWIQMEISQVLTRERANREAMARMVGVRCGKAVE